MAKRLIILSIPFVVAGLAVTCLIAIPVSMIMMIFLLIKPDILMAMQGKAEQKMVRAMFSRMTKTKVKRTYV
jgi:hypothetical protein